MILSIAKQLFENGAIQHLHAVKYPLSQENWCLMITTKDGKQTYLHTQRGEPKFYLKSDSMINDVQRITTKTLTAFSFF